jgi:hypothetical protein
VADGCPAHDAKLPMVTTNQPGAADGTKSRIRVSRRSADGPTIEALSQVPLGRRLRGSAADRRLPPATEHDRRWADVLGAGNCPKPGDACLPGSIRGSR